MPGVAASMTVRVPSGFDLNLLLGITAMHRMNMKQALPHKPTEMIANARHNCLQKSLGFSPALGILYL